MLFRRLALPVTLSLACLLPTATRAQDEGPSEQVETGATLATPPPPQEIPDWTWTQLMSAPHISSRLTTIVVDPTDPNRIYVGTDGGSVLFSEDAGTTWQELAIRAVLRTRRDVPPPELPTNTLDFPFVLHSPRPPYQPSSPFVALFENFPRVVLWDDSPPNVFRFRLVSDFFDDDPSVLSDTIRGTDVDPIQSIAVCRGARYELFVATASELFASEDDGHSWLPLLRNPDDSRIHQVMCHASRPNHVVVATDLGVYYSVDGGASFDLDTGGWPSGQAVEVSPDGEFLVASGFQLFRGGPQTGFANIYPNPEDTETAPWEAITWVARDGAEIWLATKDGVRRSPDGGATWENVAPLIFSRRWATQVMIGRDHYGRRLVAVLSRWCPPSARSPFDAGCRDTDIRASYDGGREWQSFFGDATRRSVQQMAFVPTDEGAGRWLVVTGGELWTTAPHRSTIFAPESRRWAELRMARTPPMDRVIRAGLRHLELDADDIDATIRRAHRSWLVPSIQFGYDWTQTVSEGRLEQEPTPLNRDRTTDRIFWTMFVNFRWSFQDSVQHQAEVDGTRADLLALRERVGFVLEDAWHERWLHLSRLQLGANELLQAEILRERVLALEGVLEFWLGQPLESLVPHRR